MGALDGLQTGLQDLFARRRGNEAALLRYWREHMGEGDGQPGDYDNCVSVLSKHPDKIKDPHALCQWLHIQATGHPAGHAPAEQQARHSMTTDVGLALFEKYSVEDRRQMARQGLALPDGSFPIKDKEDLSHALHDIGRTKHARSTVIAHIRKRAKALGATDMLGDKTAPDGDGDADDAEHAADLAPAGFAADGAVVLEGKVFECGDYPDKAFSLTEAEADERIREFMGCPVDLGHPETESPLDGKLGAWTAMERRGRDIWGRVELPAFVRDAAGDGPIKVSVAWDRASKLPMKLSLVTDPRVSDAALMAAFARYEAAFASRHDTPTGQRAMQEMHDCAARYGAVCKRPEASMASRHEANALQQMHDTAVEHGAHCQSMGRGGMGGYAEYSSELATVAGRRSKRMDWTGFWRGLFGAVEGEEGSAAGMAALATLPEPSGQETQIASMAGRQPMTPLNSTELDQERAARKKAEADLAHERMTRIESEAVAFAEAEIAAERSTPAEREGLIALYHQAALDDLEHGLVTFANGQHQSRVQQLKAYFGSRDRRLMTQEVFAAFSPDVLRNVMETAQANAPKPMDAARRAELLAKTPLGIAAAKRSA